MKRALLAVCLIAPVFAQTQTPRPEYPRPQFERTDWVNLNGKWQFEFDDSNAGFDARWWDTAKPFSKTITVPYCFESKLSGINDPGFHPWVWYRRTFTTPASWSGRRTLLHFGAVDYRAWVWVNGSLAGTHEGGNVPFTFDITPLLKSGENTLTVRAEDPPRDRYIPRGKQYWKEKSESIFYTRTSGIWQTVWIEPVAPSYLDHVRITSGVDGLARFHAIVDGAKPGLTFRAVVRSAGADVASASAPATDAHVWATAQVANPMLWSFDHPNLYDVLFQLLDSGKVVDEVHSYLGFRTISEDNGMVAINGRRTVLKFVLDQGYWPESNLTPPSDDAIQYDIRMTKEMGFNGARKHQKVEDPRYLYWADKMGLMVSGEMANAQEFDPGAVERFTREWMAAVERDYNHPSIVIWAPINESWGVPKLEDDPRQSAYIKGLYHLTGALDSTRPVIDNEGWQHTDETDLFAMHDYTGQGDALAAKYANLGDPDSPLPDVGRETLLSGYAYNGTPIYLSEFGGVSYIPQGAHVPSNAWGYAGLMKTQQDALVRIGSLFSAIAATPAFSGYCYTQLTDVEQEVNGLMTYDRKPKYPVEEIKKLNDMVK